MSSSVSEPTAANNTLRIAQDLIRLDTTNFGGGRAEGEQEAAEYVEQHLRNLGLAPQLVESAPRRTSLTCRVPGKDMSLPPLVVHGHLDVVPAIADTWSVDPFAATVRDGYLWGRGAVDMKNMNAMILSSVAEILNSGSQPNRELILAFFADEEDGGSLGSHYLVTEHPELFAGAEQAISEVGGYSIQVGNERAYLIQTGEKAMIWVRARARGIAGHGSRLLSSNALITLAEALVRLGRHEWRLTLNATTTQLLNEIAASLGVEPGLEHPERLVVHTGAGSGFIESSLRTTANVTMLEAGYKHNVVPDLAEAAIDIRTLPGEEEAVLAELRGILGSEIELEIVHQDIGMEVPFDADIVSSMVAALRTEDADAKVLPYLMPAGTDNKALAKLGIDGYGFVPMQLPPDFDFVAMFHGVDERIPVDALAFGHRVLSTMLRSY
jgi:acetylornithine deacetylase/succinyl-diaminopimelate desuccinylase-like protein